MLVILSGGITGIIIAHGYSARPRQLGKIRSALHMLETEIAFALTPLPDALSKTGTRIGGPAGEFFLSVSSSLDGSAVSSSGESWEAGLETLGHQGFLTSSDIDILRSFGYTLGISDREDQIRNLRLVQEQLRLQEAAADREKEGNRKLWRTVGFLGGLAVVLILY